jgi:uncharacterized protein YgbK (DUF1537 family)
LTSPADLVSLDSGSRSVAPDQIARLMKRSLEGLPHQNFPFFKKVDSALRGPVMAELSALLQTLKKDRAVLVPANPSLGRVIRDGRYFIHGVPISETDFARDPEYPVDTSEVLGILGQYSDRVAKLARATDTLSPEGIYIGDVEEKTDLTAWARQVDDRTLPAGGSEFFAAWLEVAGLAGSTPGRSATELAVADTSLFVSGSSADYSRSLSQRFRKAGLPVWPMPDELFEGGTNPEEHLVAWSNRVIQSLESVPSVRVTIDRPLVHSPELSLRLTEHLTRLIELVLDRCTVQHLCIEGGATVSELTRRLGWRCLDVRAELSTGSVVLQPSHQKWPLLITKPGSYSWPEDFLRL